MKNIYDKSIYLCMVFLRIFCTVLPSYLSFHSLKHILHHQRKGEDCHNFYFFVDDQYHKEMNIVSTMTNCSNLHPLMELSNKN